MDEVLQVFKYAHLNNASDIYFNTGEPVSFRINGEIVKETSYSRFYNSKAVFNTALLLFPSMDYSLSQEEVEKKMNGVIDFSCSFELDEDTTIRCRGSLFATVDGFSLAVRLLPDKIFSLADLRCPRGVLKLSSEYSHGLVLVTGPTGSGKSTTLAAMINHVNCNENKRIITIEDPVEYIHRSNKSIVTHRQVGKNCNTFYDGFKQSLREDPDIIFIGEIRDAETMKLAMEAAESGHLVLSTLHSSDVNESLNRIIGMFPSSMSEVVANQLSISLAGIIAQKLIKAKNGGRVAAYEVLINNPTIANIIRNNDMRHLGDYMRPDQGMVKFSDYLTGMRNKKIIVD